MNRNISKQLQKVAASLPDVFIISKVNRVVFGKELLKTQIKFNGEKIEPGKKYKVESSVATPVNHYERLKVIYLRCKKNGYSTAYTERHLADYVAHSRSVGLQQEKQKLDKTFKHKIKIGFFKRIKNFIIKLFSK